MDHFNFSNILSPLIITENFVLLPFCQITSTGLHLSDILPNILQIVFHPLKHKPNSTVPATNVYQLILAMTCTCWCVLPLSSVN